MLMNKIVIDSNKDIIIDSNGDYDISFANGNDIKLVISVSDEISAKVFIHSNSINISGKINYSLGYNSKLIINRFSFNDICNLEENIYLNGKYSSIKYNFLVFLMMLIIIK